MVVPFFDYNDATFSPDGRSLAVVHNLDPAVITIFSFPAMEELRSVPLPEKSAHTLRYSPCGRLLATSGDDSLVVLNANRLSVIEQIPIPYCYKVEFSPTAPLIAVGSGSNGEVFDITPFLNATGQP